MKNDKLILFGLVAVIIFVLLLEAAGTAPGQEINIPITEKPATSPIATPEVPTTVTITPSEEPKPDYIPTLRKYEINKDNDIWKAQDPSSYIEPDNEWVKYYADKLFVDTDGRIKYKNEEHAVVRYLDGSVDYDNKLFENNYVTLRDYFGRDIANNDYWINADYYLYNGQRGICSSWMIAVTSMLLSGETSTKQDNKFIKQVIPAKAFLGYSGSNKDGWIEYEVYGKRFLSTTGLIKENPFFDDMVSYTVFGNVSEEYKNRHIIPVFEFTDKYFRRV